MLQTLIKTIFELSTGIAADIVAIAIILLALIWVIIFDVVKMTDTRKKLKFLISELKPVEGRKAHNIQRLDDIFGKERLEAYFEQWRNYKDCGLGDGYTQKTGATKDFFTPATLIDPKASRRVAQLLPFILVTIGFVALLLAAAGWFTFTGAVNTSVTSLITLTIISFSCAVLYWIIDRNAYQKTVRMLSEVCALAESKILLYTADDLIKMLIKYQERTISEINGMSGKIGERLETFTQGKLIPSVQDEFENALKIGMIIPMDKMADKLGELADETLKIQQQNMREMADAFSERIDASISGYFKEFVTSVKRLSGIQTGIITQLSEYHEKIRDSQEQQTKLNAMTAGIAEVVSDHQKKSSENTQLITESMGKIVDFSGKLSDIVESNRALLDNLVTTRISSQEEIKGYFNKMSEMMFRLDSEMRAQSDDMFARFNDISTETFSKYESNTNMMIDMYSNNIKETFEVLNSQIMNMGLYAKEINDDIRVLNSKLETSVSDFNKKIADGVVGAFGTFDTGMADICVRLNRVLSDIKETMEELPGIVAEVKKSL